MSETIFKELEHLTRLSVALEGFDSLPKDATAMLNAFKCSSPSFESMTFGDKQVSMESIGSKIKELAIAAAKWIKVQIAEFIAFLKSGKLEIGRVEAEVDQAEKEVAEAKTFQDNEITLSPLITGYLSVNGVLDRSFVDGLTRVREVVDTILEMQPGAIKLAGHLADEVIHLSNPDNIKYKSFIDEMVEFSHRYGRKLTIPDPNKKSTVYVLNNNVEVKDMMSSPLPGGYVLTGTIIERSPIFSLGEGYEASVKKASAVESLIETIRPKLVKNNAKGISFSGEALNKSDCHTVITEARSILSLLNRSFTSENEIKAGLKRISDAADAALKVDESDMNGYQVTSMMKLLRSLTKFVDMDKSHITRYSLKVIRASVRYVHESIVPAAV